MDRISRYQIGATAALLVMAAFFTAYAVPTQDEVDKARAVCATHKQRVQALEKNSPNDIARITKERAAWLKSCTRASELMDQREGKPASQPASQ